MKKKMIFYDMSRVDGESVPGSVPVEDQGGAPA